MYIIVDESTYNTILQAYGADFVIFDEDENEYGVYYLELIDAGYAQEIDGAIYTISMNPSQKGIFIGNL